MDDKNNLNNDKTKQDPVLDKYQQIVEFAHKEIEIVRSNYRLVGSFFVIVIVAGIWFTYKTGGDFREEMRSNITEHKETLKVLKKEVETRVDEELGKEAIQNLIKEKVTKHVDKVAEAIIIKQIENKINPKITEAERKLLALDQEITKIKRRNHITELADKAISDADRFALDELKKIRDEAETGSPEQSAAEAEGSRVIIFWGTSRRLTDLQGTDAYDNSGIKYTSLSTKKLINLLLSDKRWQVRRECARLLSNKKEVEVAVALAKALKSDSDLGVVNMALQSFKNVTGMPIMGFLVYESALEWWEKNKDEVIKKLKKKK